MTKQGNDRAATLCLAAAGLLCFVLMWCWAAGTADLLETFTSESPTLPLVRMLAVLLLCSVILQRARPQQRMSIITGYLAAAVAVCLGLWANVRLILDLKDGPDFWLVSTMAQISPVPVLPVNPVTGAMLAVFGAGMVLWMRGSGRASVVGRMLLWTALIVSVLSLYSSFLTFLGISAMRERAIAPELSTFFVALAAALLWSPSGAKTAEKGLSPGAADRALARTYAPVGVALCFALLASGLAAIYFRHERAEHRRDAHELLLAISDLKTRQIASWRDERLSDARFFSQASFVARDVAAFLASPESLKSRGELLHWLRLLKGDDRYASVVLRDANSTARLSIPKDVAVEPEQSGVFDQVVRSGKIFFSDFLLHSETGRIDLTIGFPVFLESFSDEQEVVPPVPFVQSPVGRVIGVILLTLDPRVFLYPMIQSWPTPSETAEIILAEREGRDIRVLNDLRMEPGRAMTILTPHGESNIFPGILENLGAMEVSEGTDYRGIPVLAAARPVAGLPWILIAKVDCEEIYASMRTLGWVTLGMTLLASICGGAFAWVLMKHRELRLTKNELDAEKRRRIYAERLEYLMKNANDVILIIDASDRIIQANDRAVETLGYARDELYGMRMDSLRFDQGPEISKRLESEEQNGSILFETRHRRKDGSAIPVEVSASRIEMDGVSYTLEIVRDVTQRLIHQHEIERLNRLYEALSELNKCVVRIRSRDEIFTEICRVIARYGDYAMVWIGAVDPANFRVRPVAESGFGSEFLSGLLVYTDDRPEGYGPTGTAVREDRPCIVNDFLESERSRPWRPVALAENLRSAAAFAVHFEGKVWGSFSVYSHYRDAFGASEVSLLQEAADDISFALETLAKDERRHEVEAALYESTELYHSLFENMLDGFAYCRMIYEGGAPADFEYLNVNPSFSRLTGLQNVEGRRITDLIPGIRESNPEIFEIYGRVAQTGASERFETYLPALGSWLSVAVYSPKREHFVAVFDNITERKRSEEERELLLAVLHQITVSESLQDLVRKVTELLQQRLRFEAIGIRLRLGGDFPYAETRGFPPEFVKHESSLCARDSEGRLLRDTNGAPVLECMCGNVLSGRFDPQKPFFTEKGSFWTNSTSELLASTTAADRMARTRNRCNTEGYESVALIPLRAMGTTYGLLQLDDRERGRFTPERISLFERVADNIAIAIAHHQTQETLRESEERYRRLFQNSNDAIFLSSVSSDGRTMKFVDVNPVACRRLEYTREELLRLSPVDVNPGFTAGRLAEFVQRLSDSNGAVIETVHQTKSGRTFPVEISVQKFELRGHQFVLSIVRDISERKQVENALRASVEAAQAATRTKSQFLANMSHEIRTPMNGILGMTELILGTMLSAEQREFLETIHGSASALLVIINDILDFSKIEAGKLVISAKPFVFRQFIKRTSDVLTGRMADKNLQFVADVDNAIPAHLVGDSVRLGQVIINLLGNAVKFTPSGGRIQLSVQEISTSEEKQRGGIVLQFTVTDNGIGIPPEKLADIFEPFTQVDGTAARPYGGTGLGLTISGRLVELMGGKLWAESKVGSGSAFHFTAALGVGAGGSEEVAETSVKRKPDLAAYQPPVNVLLAEDNLVNSRVVESILRKNGALIVVAPNGQEALKCLYAAEASPFDLVLMDVQMPVMDGYEATRVIREQEASNGGTHIPIIALTAHALEGDDRKCLDAGMDDYLAKPFTSGRLIEAVDRWVQVRRRG